MLQLSPHEARVLGVLIEKAATVPETYPLSLNGLVVGCNQKSNRDPVTAWDEDTVFDAAESLREKGLVTRVDQAGARVHKYRHEAQAKLSLRAAEQAIIAELLLRGPQTMGELRQRCDRMAPGAFDAPEALRGHLTALASRETPLVRETPAGRAPRWMQLLCPTEPPAIHAAAADDTPSSPPGPAASGPSGSGLAVAAGPSLLARIEALEAEVARLRQTLDDLTSP